MPEPRYVIITGGVVSSLGKGIAAASLGQLLRARGLRVKMQKLDPYLNLDPGTMSPYQHGEVFVTADGAETDLDLGHYERFTDVPADNGSTHTAGKIYEEVLRRERAGEYLGATIQVIPHVTDEIRRRIVEHSAGADVAIIEIGGTVGDIESLPFFEALRQLRRQVGPQRMMFVHVTLVPFIEAASELKTKPTQHSVQELRRLGITPDALLLRSSSPVSDDMREKIALFCDLDQRAVIPCPDARDIYEVPLILNAGGFDNLVCQRLELSTSAVDLAGWRSVCERIIGASVPVRVAIVGKYIEHQDAYISIVEALRHAAADHHRYLDLKLVDAEQVTASNAPGLFTDCDAVLVPGGFGDRGFEGKVSAANWARTSGTPFLGICLGLQAAVVEYARHRLGLKTANSREFSPRGRNLVIDLSPEQQGVRDMGGTMRLGEQQAALTPGSALAELYGNQNSVRERHRHRFEVNEKYVNRLSDAGLVISARHPDRGLVECVELPRDVHRFYHAVQYHPEFSSRPTRPHPLFSGLIAAAVAQ